MPRLRIPIKSLADIKNDPDFRITFPPDHHQDFLDLVAISDSIKVPLIPFGRHVLLVFKRKFMALKDANKEEAGRMITEVIQSMHGLHQINLFEKGDQWENIAVSSARNGSKAAKLAEPTEEGKRKQGEKIAAALSRMEKENKKKKIGKAVKHGKR